MSRIALIARLPGVRHGLVDQVAVTFPLEVGRAGKQLGDIGPALPPSRRSRHQPCGEATRNRDLDLLTILDTTNETGCILAQFTEADGGHSAMVAHVLLVSPAAAVTTPSTAVTGVHNRGHPAGPGHAPTQQKTQEPQAG